MHKDHIDSSEDRNEILQMEKYKLEQKLKSQKEENLRLRQMMNEDSEESDGTKLIYQKEQELMKLKKQHNIAKSSKEGLYGLYNASPPKSTRYRKNDTFDTDMDYQYNKLGSSWMSREQNMNLNRTQTAGFAEKSLIALNNRAEDPFWKKRNEDMHISQERFSRRDKLNHQITTPRTRDTKEKMDPAKMQPAGRISIERLTNNMLDKRFSCIKITPRKDNSHL
jgi:hypothetical protein